MALKQDELDPVNYFGLPGFTWDSAFKMTGAEIDLLQESEMYRFFEAGIRGGKKLQLLCFCFVLMVNFVILKRHDIC